MQGTVRQSPREEDGEEKTVQGEQLPIAQKKISNSFCATPKISHK